MWLVRSDVDVCAGLGVFSVPGGVSWSPTRSGFRLQPVSLGVLVVDGEITCGNPRVPCVKRKRGMCGKMNEFASWNNYFAVVIKTGLLVVSFQVACVGRKVKIPFICS